MRKRKGQPTRSGQLAGAQLKISGVHNDGLRKSVTIINRGSVAQPMGGWALATLRGKRFYFFPDDLFVLPSMSVTTSPLASAGSMRWTTRRTTCT